MEQGSEDLSERVRKEIEKILADSNVTEEMYLESIPPEIIERLHSEAKQFGFSESFVNELIQAIIPSRAAEEKREMAESIAKEYLPNLADEVIDGIPYLTTRRWKDEGMERLVKITVGKPELSSLSVEVPLYLKTLPIIWELVASSSYQQDKKPVMTEPQEMDSGAVIRIVETESGTKIIAPSKREFRELALEAALYRFAAPLPPSYPPQPRQD